MLVVSIAEGTVLEELEQSALDVLQHAVQLVVLHGALRGIAHLLETTLQVVVFSLQAIDSCLEQGLLLVGMAASLLGVTGKIFDDIEERGLVKHVIVVLSQGHGAVYVLCDLYALQEGILIEVIFIVFVSFFRNF